MVSLTECLPALAEILVKQSISGFDPQPNSTAKPNEALARFMQIDQPAQAFTLEFAIHAAEKRDEFLLHSILSPIAHACLSMPDVPSLFFHRFTHALACITDPMPSSSFFNLVFDDFLLNFVSCEGVARQLHQLLWQLCERLKDADLIGHFIEASRPAEDVRHANTRPGGNHLWSHNWLSTKIFLERTLPSSIRSKQRNSMFS